MDKLKIRKELIKYQRNLVELKKLGVIKENERLNKTRDIKIVENKIKMLEELLKNE